MVLAVGLCAIAVVIAIDRGKGQTVGGDFHVFWQAGRNFATGAPLYHGDLPGARRFIYPPFAAMVFQLFAVFPLPVAAEILSFVNLLLLGVTIALTKSIIERTFPDRTRGPLPLVLGVALSLLFYLDNFSHVQINEVICVLVLLGIDAHLRGWDVRAAAYFVVATAIKITPVFFVIWLLLRGRRRAALAVPVVAMACVVVPLLARGPATGAAELSEYYHSFLEGFQHGQVLTDSRVQNLGAMVYRAVPSERTAALTYRVAAGLLLLLFLASLGRLRLNDAAVSSVEVSTVFLISHLLSPITWRAHLVTLLFVYSTFLALRPSTLGRLPRFVLPVLWALMTVSGLGRDVIGNEAFNAIARTSVVVWTMMLLLVTGVAVTWLSSPEPQGSAR